MKSSPKQSNTWPWRPSILSKQKMVVKALFYTSRLNLAMKVWPFNQAKTWLWRAYFFRNQTKKKAKSAFSWLENNLGRDGPFLFQRKQTFVAMKLNSDIIREKKNKNKNKKEWSNQWSRMIHLSALLDDTHVSLWEEQPGACWWLVEKKVATPPFSNSSMYHWPVAAWWSSSPRCSQLCDLLTCVTATLILMMRMAVFGFFHRVVAVSVWSPWECRLSLNPCVL